jgi:hypothetical protein
MDSRSTFRPRLWSASVETSWERASGDALEKWNRRHGLGGKLTDAVVADAVALGHGARRRYPELQAWEGALEAHVKDEWVSNGPVASPWSGVNAAVRHGWEHAGPLQGQQRWHGFTPVRGGQRPLRAPKGR